MHATPLRFDTLILKKCEAQAKHGVDPDGARFLWKLWWFEAEEGADMLTFNRKFADVPGIGDSDPPYNMYPDLNPTHAFSLLVNEEVIASVLEGPAKGEIPFVYVVDTRYWPLIVKMGTMRMSITRDISKLPWNYSGNFGIVYPWGMLGWSS
ncbi:hypothetical protein BOTNAR_0293g00040 [Botryotinia narcissicola]|uniref:Uncharacterized protein n=1 Tax=Botryotinia narcissicola TaxID=278944 RepID=A0A4Z1HWS1_9HELO|nr:hypothetical protein BOTNAR_0293g00040 [Botryotinia narcissicola]